MSTYQTIKIEIEDQMAILWLARPEVHNAIDDQMITELSDFFTTIESNLQIRVIVIRGEGESFCSGADLQWMKRSFALTQEENLKESQTLSHLFALIFNSSKIVISVAHGNIFGGGVGLVAVSDLAFGYGDARFSLSETKIGMAASSITPYLLTKINSSHLKELIFTAKKFDATDATKYGLLNQSFIDTKQLETYLAWLIEQLLSNGKQAIIESKKLINRLLNRSMMEEIEEVPKMLARIRISPEAQEGFAAFLEKRKPQW